MGHSYKIESKLLFIIVFSISRLKSSPSGISFKEINDYIKDEINKNKFRFSQLYICKPILDDFINKVGSSVFEKKEKYYYLSKYKFFCIFYTFYYLFTNKETLFYFREKNIKWWHKKQIPLSSPLLLDLVSNLNTHHHENFIQDFESFCEPDYLAKILCKEKKNINKFLRGNIPGRKVNDRLKSC